MGQRGSRYHMIGQGLLIQGLGGSTGVVIWGIVKSKCGKHRFVRYPVTSEKVVGELASLAGKPQGSLSNLLPVHTVTYCIYEHRRLWRTHLPHQACPRVVPNPHIILLRLIHRPCELSTPADTSQMGPYSYNDGIIKRSSSP